MVFEGLGSWLTRWRIGLGLAALVCVALLSLSCAAAPAQAPPATATPGWPVITPAPLPTAAIAYPDPELGDCFGGVFSRVDAMQCYVLEGAQSAGVIDIEKIYEDGGILRISLNQNGPVDYQVYLFLRERTAEFLDRWPYLVPYDDRISWCTHPFGGYRECLLDVVNLDRRVPATADYRTIVFHVGGSLRVVRSMDGRVGVSCGRQWPPGRRVPGETLARSTCPT